MNKQQTTLQPIDLVYLWVDGNDPVWQDKRNKTIGVTEEKSATNCDGRYANHDELLYSLRSAEKFAPWINHIYIVTDGQTPEWLDTNNPKVSIIDHSEIMPAEALPCFNSSAIEHFLWRIPGLSEHFLYANDDMYFGRTVESSDFFAPDGLPYIRQNRRPFRRPLLWLKSKISGKKMSHYNHIVQNAAELIASYYGKYYGAKAHHNIDAYLKSDFEYTYRLFLEQLEPTFSNHMRSDNDIPRHFEKLRNAKPMLFCMNDSEYATEADRIRSKEVLAERFAEKSSFEK